LKQKIKQLMKGLADTDEILMWQFSNASFVAPLNSQGANLFRYLGTKHLKKQERDVPKDIKLNELSDEDQYELDRLRERVKKKQKQMLKEFWRTRK